MCPLLPVNKLPVGSTREFVGSIRSAELAIAAPSMPPATKTTPLGSSVAVNEDGAKEMFGTGENIPVDGSYNSASGRICGLLMEILDFGYASQNQHFAIEHPHRRSVATCCTDAICGDE